MKEHKIKMGTKFSWYRLCVCIACLILPASCEVGPGFCHKNDPCQVELRSLDVYGRSVDCPYYGTFGQCDYSLTEGWYKVNASMPTTCPSLDRCGTSYPVWLNGTIPTSGIVTKNACMRGFTSCCEKVYTIVLKKCSDFVAYCLQHTTGCAERYCFGTTGSCPVPSITKTRVTSTPSTGVNTFTQSSTDRTSLISSTDGDSSAFTLSQLPKTTASNTEQSDMKPYLTATVIGVISSILIFVVICGVLLKRHFNRHQSKEEKGDTTRRRESTEIESDGSHYYTLDTSTMEAVHTYSQPIKEIEADGSHYNTLDAATMEAEHKYSQPFKGVAEGERSQYEALGTRGPAPLYDQVNTGNFQVPDSNMRSPEEAARSTNTDPVDGNAENQRTTPQSTRILEPCSVYDEMKIDENQGKPT